MTRILRFTRNLYEIEIVSIKKKQIIKLQKKYRDKQNLERIIYCRLYQGAPTTKPVSLWPKPNETGRELMYSRCQFQYQV